MQNQIHDKYNSNSTANAQQRNSNITSVNTQQHRKSKVNSETTANQSKNKRKGKAMEQELTITSNNTEQSKRTSNRIGKVSDNQAHINTNYKSGSTITHNTHI